MRFKLIGESKCRLGHVLKENGVLFLDLRDNTLKHAGELEKNTIFSEHIDGCCGGGNWDTNSLYAYDESKVELVLISTVLKENRLFFRANIKKDSVLSMQEIYKYLSALEHLCLGTKSIIKIKEFEDFEDLESLVNSLSDDCYTKEVLDKEFCSKFISKTKGIK